MNIAKPKRKRTRSRSRYYADRICGAYVILSEGKCATCGSREQLTPGHYFGRSLFNVRFDLRNLACQCITCNIAHESDPEPLREIIEGRIGPDKLNNLWLRANCPPFKLDYDSIVEDFRSKLKPLPRFKKLSTAMQIKVLAGTYTNTALLEEMNG
jgi:hypothetical protein